MFSVAIFKEQNFREEVISGINAGYLSMFSIVKRYWE